MIDPVIRNDAESGQSARLARWWRGERVKSGVFACKNGPDARKNARNAQVAASSARPSRFGASLYQNTIYVAFCARIWSNQNDGARRQDCRGESRKVMRRKHIGASI